MAITTPTPFSGLMPDDGDPASFDARMMALMLWITQKFGPEIAAASGEIAATLNGEATTLDALGALAATVAGLGSAADRDFTDNNDLAVAPGNIGTRGNTAAAISALQSSLLIPKEIIRFDMIAGTINKQSGGITITKIAVGHWRVNWKNTAPDVNSIIIVSGGPNPTYEPMAPVQGPVYGAVTTTSVEIGTGSSSTIKVDWGHVTAAIYY